MPAAVLFCLVVAITDGDTLTARCETTVGLQSVKVRLAEVDAPEMGQPFGNRSKQQLARLCFRKTALLLPETTDRYDRTVARVECDGDDASTEQVRSGMAWVFDKYATDASIYDLEADARYARRGLWADATPVAPWAWRSARRPAGAGPRN
jgi:endonuclease YncB( thermonuclease family)